MTGEKDMTSATRQRILKTAHDLFYRDGFNVVGLDRIIGDVGVTKTTFYNHFQSKDDLMLEVLQMHDRWWRQTFTEKLRELGGETPRGQIMAAFDVISELVRADDYNGCIFINVAIQFPWAHDPAHRVAADHKAALTTIIRQLAAYAGASDASSFAEEFCLVLEGTYITHQVNSNPEAVRIGRRIGQMLVDKYLPADKVQLMPSRSVAAT
jgi:AcrR family transcriptional regulator